MGELQKQRPAWVYAAVAAALIALTAAIQLAMGRLLVSDSGRLMLWAGHVGPENSQQFADWYSLSHLIHGMAFYGLLHWLSRAPGTPGTPGTLGKWSLGARFVLAVLLETGWEVIENTPWVIARYREHTAALGYTGDTVLNSACDTLFAITGFFLAWRLPVWATLALIVSLELVSLLVIRDNLTLNIVMLLFPVEAIKQWQAGG